MKLFLILTCFCVVIFSGCQRGKKVVVIPDKDTAAEQYGFAQQRVSTGIPPSADAAKKVFYTKQQNLFQKVVDRFPDDAVYTPNAILEIADILYKAEKYETVIKYLNVAIPLYKNQETFQARALLKTGRAQDRLRKHKKAKETYQKCIYLFEDSEDKRVQEIVRLAKRYYDILYDIPQNN